MTEGEATGKSKMGCLKIGLIGIGGLFGLMVLGAIVGGGTPPPVSDSGAPGSDSVAALSGEAAPPAPAEPALTGPQTNARRSAESYLAMSGFSRKGLIEQLSSDAADGYEVADATAAVDSLNADWKAQAVRSAQSYLAMSGFSCNGLIEQLSSDAGDGYTREEAEHGARGAGAC